MPADLCIFCFEEHPLTREHLVSKPIERAFRLDGESTVAELEYPPTDPGDPEIRLVQLRDMKVRIACRACNNGWMANLEEAAASAIEAWLRDGRLCASGCETISRWLATRLLVWTVRGGRLRDLEQAIGDGDPSVIPHFDRAKRLAAGADDAIDGLAVGAARSDEGVGYGFGNARTFPNGIRKPFTGVLALNFPPLQLWVADALSPAEVRLPNGVTELRDGLRLLNLRRRGGDLSPDQAQVTFAGF